MYLVALIKSWQAVTQTKEEVPVMRLLLVIYCLRHTRQHSCPIPMRVLQYTQQVGSYGFLRNEYGQFQSTTCASMFCVLAGDGEGGREGH